MVVMADKGSLRISDAERDRVVARLRDALSEGRLDLEEFNHRLEVAYQSKTHGEIAVLTKDLPKGSGRAPAVVDPAASVAKRQRRFRRRLRTYLGVNLVVWAIWLTSDLTGGHDHYLWPLWVTVPWGTTIAWRRFS